MRPPIEDEIEAAEVEVADDGQQTAVMLVSTRLAGNAVIRVVNRCTEAQESNHLGELRTYPPSSTNPLKTSTRPLCG